MSPRVSVIVAAHNAANFVARAVDSVLAQTYVDREVLVVDDGSTDDTEAVLARYAEAIRVLAKPNGGPASTRNHGIRHARGDLVAFLDADDWWLPEKLARQVALLDARTDVGFCSTATRVVDPDGRDMNLWVCPDPGAPALEAIFANTSAISGSTSGVLARRALVEKVGGFDESLNAFEDPDLWIRLAAVTQYACIAEPLTVVEKRPSGRVSTNLDRMRECTLRSLRKNRMLLSAQKRRRFWSRCYATTLLDYAKWEYRAGRRTKAGLHAMEALARAPLARGRLALGLVLAMVRRQPL